MALRMFVYVGLLYLESEDQQPGGDAMLPTVEEAVEYWKYGERLGEAQGLLMRALIKRFGGTDSPVGVGRVRRMAP
jgi:hypothetical protein